MKIYKETMNNRKQIVVQDGDNKFIIGWYGADLYWIMQDYVPNNKFTITEDIPYLYVFFKNLFSTEYFANNTFTSYGVTLVIACANFFGNFFALNGLLFLYSH